MPGPYRERVRLLAMKMESTSGVDSVPDPLVDSIRTVGMPLPKPGFLESGNRDDVQTGQLISTPRAAPAGPFWSFDVTVEVAGSRSGSPYDATVANSPEADVLLRISGMARTVTNGVSILYKTIDQGMETASAYCWTAGKLLKLVGCVATCRFAADAAKRGLLTFTVTGMLAASTPLTEAALPSYSISQVAPPLFHSGLVSIGTWTSATVGDPLVLKHAEFDLGNVITARDSAGAVDGIIGYLVSDRKTRQTLDVEVPGLATFDAYSMARALAGSLPVSSYQVGTASQNRMKVRTGTWALEAPDPGAANSIMTNRLQGNLTNVPNGATTSGREIELLFD